MITVSILINGKVLFARTASNKTKEYSKKYPDVLAEGVNYYKVDDGQDIFHRPDDGAVKLAILMLKLIKEP